MHISRFMFSFWDVLVAASSVLKKSVFRAESSSVYSKKPESTIYFFVQMKHNKKTSPNYLQFKNPNVELDTLQVYMAAGAVYGLEADLSDLEECARGISSTTSDMELSFLEEQVASAAAKVQQSELQVGSSCICAYFHSFFLLNIRHEYSAVFGSCVASSCSCFCSRFLTSQPELLL